MRVRAKHRLWMKYIDDKLKLKRKRYFLQCWFLWSRRRIYNYDE